MLDQTTKRQLDSAKNILVGKVPDPKTQVEQITTALIYKFMDDMDKRSEELGGKVSFFTNDFAQYSWTKLLDKKISGQERLDLYVQAITNMSKNPHIPQLFRDIFKGAFLPYNDPRTLSLFLKEINEFNYEHSENLGNAFEYLLSILGSQGDLGQFRTPRHIIDFIVAVVAPKKNETILDPACGTAGFLISAYKHILQAHKEKTLSPDEKSKLMNNLVGYDIAPDMVKLALVNMYLHGFPEPKIHEYDSLTSEKRWDEQFDVILANPPFMTPKGGIQPHKRFSIKANRSEVLFIDYIMEHLSIKGCAGIIVPEGIIFKGDKAYKALRKKLVEDGLFAVVSLPAGVFQPYSGVKTSILLFDNQVAKQADEMLFVKIENVGYDLGAQRRVIENNDLPEALEILAAWKTNKKKKSNLALWAKKEKIAESGDYNLTADLYREVEEYKNQKWPMVDMQEIVEFQEGPGIRSFEYDNKGYPIINVRCVQDGYLNLDNCKKVRLESANGKWKHFQVDEGDILFTTSGTIGRVAIVAHDDLPLLMNTSVVRFKTKNNSLDRNFLYQILRSKSFVETLKEKATGVAQKNVGPMHIKQIKIPLPPLEVQKEIVAQIEVKQNAINHAREIIKNLESERRYFGQELRKLEDVECVELGEVCETISGGTPLKSKSEYYKDGKIPWLKSGEVNQGLVYESKQKITKLGLKESSAKLFPENTVLVAMYGATAGKVGLLKFESSTNQAICGILPSDKFLPKFLYMYLKTQTDRMVKLSGGGAQPNISQTIIKELKIPLPPLEVQKQLVAEAEKEEEIITANKNLIKIMEKKIEKVIAEI